MKRLYLFLLIIVLTTYNVLAQVKGGIRFGGSISNTAFKDMPDYFYPPIYQLGFLGGIWTSMPLKNNFHLQPELLFTVKGWDYTLYYLNLPLMVGYKPFSKVAILVGPEGGYLFNPDPFNHFPGSQFTPLHRWELGLATGISWQAFEEVGFDIRYSHGLTNIADWVIWGNDHSLVNYKGGKNRSFQISITNYFNKKR